MKRVKDERTDEAICEAQYAAPNDASDPVPLKAGKEQLQRKEMVRKHVCAVRINRRPDKAEGIEQNKEATDAHCVCRVDAAFIE